MDGTYATNGAAPRDASNQPAKAGSKLRTPTVHEALPYTPLSSIVPFTPDVIPVPVALSRLTPSVFSDPAEGDTAKQLLQQLSHGATNAETASKRIKQTLSDVQRLLDPGSLTTYKFKKHKTAQAASTTEVESACQSPPLTSFAKMVLANTKVAYRYLTPDSEPDTKTISNGVRTGAPPRQVETPINGDGVPQPLRQQPQTASSSQQRRVEAVIPTALTPSERARFQLVPNDSSHTANLHNAKAANTDQRPKGDSAVQNLQNLLLEIFEAEDRLHVDASDQPDTVFNTRDAGDGPISVFRHVIQAKLDSCMYKVIAHGRFQDIEIDDLVRIQKLCEPSVSMIPALSLYILGGWTDEEEEEWASRVEIAECGLIACRTWMRVMSAGAQLKELQSEVYLAALLEGQKAILERCIIPIVEERPLSGEKIRGEKTQPPPNPKFETAANHRKPLLSLMNVTTKAFRLLGDFLVQTDFDEQSLSSVEYLCKTLIFAENATTEKESALGMQAFETLRRCAMDVLAKIFTKYTDQRQFIFDEILISLEKLPATKQSARQYRLTDAKPIQLVSALLMRLVQTSATKNAEALKLRSKAQDDDEGAAGVSDEEEEEEESQEDGDEDSSDNDSDIRVSPSKDSSRSIGLETIAKPLHEAARQNAWYIVKILTQRAASTSKTSDEPFRKLLDIFTEDFLNVLGLTDWPAAELLLRTLTMHMIQIVEGDKSTVPSRTLALELLGTMGCGILELQFSTRAAMKNLDPNESPISRQLQVFATELEGGQKTNADLIAFDGPYRYLVHYLEARDNGEDAQLPAARGYHLMEWAFAAISRREGSADSDASGTTRLSQELQGRLKQMLTHPRWLDDQATYNMPSTAEGRMASMILTLNSPFCRAFERIFTTLLNSMSSEQSRVKSRSMASVVTLLEKDPGILERNQNVLNYIMRATTDSSSLVRDSALGLIERCLTLRPDLDASIYVRVIERTKDAAISVRKRALKMLKEIYLRKKSSDIRAAVADAIISRMEDSEDSVVEIARATMEEIWFHAFYGLKLGGDRAVQAKLAFASQAALLIQTVEDNDNMLQVLESLIRRLLTVSKTREANERVCKSLVITLFDGVVDNNEIPTKPSQDQILRPLTVFARASPELFTTPQLERLEPYTQNLTSTDDLDVYRSAITILRNVMPHKPTMNINTLKTLQTTLLTSVTRLQKSELREVAPCLWTIDNMLGDQGKQDRIPNFMISVLHKIHQAPSSEQAVDDKTAATLAKLMRIVGEFGNAYNFDNHRAEIQKRCSWSKAESVAGLLVETLSPFTSPKRPLTIRVAALEAICTISQAWPKQFLRPDVTNAFEIVFQDRIADLEEVLLTGLAGFFTAQEVPDEAEDALEVGKGVATGSERLGKTYVASDHDGASTGLAQRFLSQFLDIALRSCDAPAFVAARLVVSINKQGLVHPKESAPALVALQTCPNTTVAMEAFKEHKSQFQKHESLFEKEYMRAVQQTFEYQQDVVGDATGYRGSPPESKLHLTWEVLKTGKAQIRRKFLANLAQKLDFDPSRLDVGTTGLQHLSFVRFCLENLAFFDYDKVDDLLQLTSSLDKIFAGTGSAVAQAIESEVLRLRVDAVTGSDNTASHATSGTIETESTQGTLHSKRLLQLALSSRLLCLIWETRSFIHKLWNLQKHVGKPKAHGKDANKAATRATNAPHLIDTYLRRIKDVSVPIHTEEAARDMCGAFVELITVDHEVKVGSDEDAEGEMMDGYATPSDSTDRRSPSMPPSGASRGRKRKSSNANGVPRKKAQPSLGKRRSTSGKFTEDDDDDGEGGWD